MDELIGETGSIEDSDKDGIRLVGQEDNRRAEGEAERDLKEKSPAFYDRLRSRFGAENS